MDVIHILILNASNIPVLYEEEYVALIALLRFLARHCTAVSSEPLNRVLLIYCRVQTVGER